MFIKTKEFKQRDNDVYFIEVLFDKIIINDNYDGILILDTNLNLIKRINIFKGIIVYSLFIKNEEVLLYCPDNECIVHIDVSTYEYSIIYLKNGQENLIFSTLYEWNENGVVLTTHNDDFYSVYIRAKTIQKINHKELERLYPKVYELYQKLNNFKVVKVFSDEYEAIIVDEEHNFSMLNNKEQFKHVLKNLPSDFHDIEFRNGAFAVVNENSIEVFTSNDKALFFPNKNCIFLKARFFVKNGGIGLLALSSSQSDVSYSKIDMFEQQ
ncbi:hypothetical protein [Rummeliibacillus suwonensis]|uniref:hypothetical protein n=1 Tax=Rummeliibacillus suwonensis TaxID=1306154 RepID=UPI00289FAC62|nr:hypothetical protein [Rummeliibacillus suwonensis]